MNADELICFMEDNCWRCKRENPDTNADTPRCEILTDFVVNNNPRKEFTPENTCTVREPWDWDNNQEPPPPPDPNQIKLEL